LKIHIPWTHLYSHPTKIEVDGFYLLLSPKTGLLNKIFVFYFLIKIDVNYSPERSEKEEYQSKMKQVKKVEQFRDEREEYGLFYLFIIY